MKVVLMISMAALLLTGCGKSSKTKPEMDETNAVVTAVAKSDVSQSKKQAPATLSNTVPAKSTARQVVDGFTGKTAVDAGKRAKVKIDKIDKIEIGKKNDMNAILDF